MKASARAAPSASPSTVPSTAPITAMIIDSAAGPCEPGLARAGAVVRLGAVLRHLAGPEQAQQAAHLLKHRAPVDGGAVGGDQERDEAAIRRRPHCGETPDEQGYHP